MHPEAMEWVRRHAPLDARTILDIGGRNVNGTPAKLFAVAEIYRTLDILPGADIQADAGTWQPNRRFDLVLACEVFEHAINWPDIVRTAWRALTPGGIFIATMAGPGRPVHSGVDGSTTLRPGEHYANVAPDDLERVLRESWFVNIQVDSREAPADVRCRAERAE